MMLIMYQLCALALADGFVYAATHAKNSVANPVATAYFPSRTYNCLVAISVMKSPGTFHILYKIGIKLINSNSHMMDFLQDVYCTVSVEKSLPTCEHIVGMMCSADPHQYSCRKKCSGTMLRCSRTCGAQCHQCQTLNPPAEDQLAAVIFRSKHMEHPCERTLFCEHRCQNMLSYYETGS